MRTGRGRSTERLADGQGVSRGSGLAAAGCMVLSVLVAAGAVRAVEPSNASAARYVSAESVKGWLDEGRDVTLLDVRQADEFAAGHIPGAVNVGYDEIASMTGQRQKETPIVLYCIHSAHRAPAAAKTLRELGFEDLYVLDGGIVAWQAEGYPIAAQDLAKAATILPKTERCAALTEP